MAPKCAVRGSIPEIIRNDENLYEGNLVHYFRVVFNHAQNLQNPYHNFRHMLHVTWACFQACIYYGNEGRLSPRQMRNLLIAALFHDFDHSGMVGNDDLNIQRSLRGFEKYILDEDRPFDSDIRKMIWATMYPYEEKSEGLDLCSQIIRDADLGQALSVAWIQQVVFGLAAEWGKKPIEVLRSQGQFHSSLRFATEWGREMFPQEDVDAKIAEARELQELLEELS